MIDEKCKICKTPDRRALIELGWNGKMSAIAISEALGGAPGPDAILKHLKQHTEQGHERNIPVIVEPMRDRVYAIQKLQVEEIERRVIIAQQRAEQWNRTMREVEGFEERDWSSFFDILSKDMQAAVSSIIKTQALNDRREKATGDLKLGLFEAMANAGLAPKALIGGSLPALPAGDDDPDD